LGVVCACVYVYVSLRVSVCLVYGPGKPQKFDANVAIVFVSLV